MMKKLFVLINITLALSVSGQNLMPYKIYTSKGKAVKFEEVVKTSAKSDLIFFGELHNNPICHWLQLELTKALFEIKGQNISIGAEMFEADDQLKIKEYFADLINESSFEKEARIWNNYKTDYKPILEFAKKNDLEYIATNIPRRYALFISKNGLEKLDTFSIEAQKYMAPLPINANMELASYKSIEKMAIMHGGTLPFMAQAQAIKDATMAHFILLNIREKELFLHLNGTFHSNNYEGIVWFVKNENSNIKILTIASVEQDDVNRLDAGNEGLADIILVINSTMCKTY